MKVLKEDCLVYCLIFVGCLLVSATPTGAHNFQVCRGAHPPGKHSNESIAQDHVFGTPVILAKQSSQSVGITHCVHTPLPKTRKEKTRRLRARAELGKLFSFWACSVGEGSVTQGSFEKMRDGHDLIVWWHEKIRSTNCKYDTPTPNAIPGTTYS